MSRLRLAISAFDHRAYVGRIAKDGISFTDAKQDVTNDFLKAVVDYFNEHEVVITTSKGRAFKVRCEPCEFPAE